MAGRALQRSHWPDVLRSDSVRRHGVRFDVSLLTRMVSLIGVLITIAGVVTPLGLYLSFNRFCYNAGPVPCPFSDTVAIVTANSTGITYDYPYSYDIDIPEILLEIYSSGTGNDTTISNYFDIQWRRFLTTSNGNFVNGSTYLIGNFRSMSSVVLDNDTQTLEGLIVDSVNGGIGFRNHTIPPGFQYGVTWSEDILFMEPESVCVDTNLTLDYTLASTVNYTIVVQDLVLTDRGGFANLQHIYPYLNLSDTQADPDLYTRAYKAAYV